MLNSSQSNESLDLQLNRELAAEEKNIKLIEDLQEKSHASRMVTIQNYDSSQTTFTNILKMYPLYTDADRLLYELKLILHMSVQTDDLDKCFDERKLAKIVTSPRLSPKSAMKQRIVDQNKDLTCLIKSKVQLGINECTFEAIALISSLTHESLSDLIHIVNEGQDEEVTKVYPHMVVGKEGNIKLFVNGVLICRPNNFGQGLLLTLGAYYVFDLNFDKAARSTLEILAKMLTWNKACLRVSLAKLLDDIQW